MFCGNCGNKIDGDGNFCDSCGHPLKKAETSVPATVKKESVEPVKPSSADILWKKFLEIIKAEGDKAKKFHDIPSDAAWELMSRFSGNGLNNLTEEFKLDFNQQPYKAIEALKAYLLDFVFSAYRVFIAEQLLAKKNIKKINIENPEDLAEEWQRVHRNMTNKIIVISDDVFAVLDGINNQTGNGLFRDNPTLKDLPKAVVDAIKDKLASELINGYLLGIAEDNIRNKD